MSDNISDSVAAFRLRAIERTGADPRDVTAMIYSDHTATRWSASVWIPGAQQVRGEGDTPAAALTNLAAALRKHRERVIRRRLEEEMQLAAD